MNQRDIHCVHLLYHTSRVINIQKGLYFISNEINGLASRCFDHFSDYFLTAHLSATRCVCVSSVCVLVSLRACVLTTVAEVLVVLEASCVCEIGVGAEAGHTHTGLQVMEAWLCLMGDKRAVSGEGHSRGSSGSATPCRRHGRLLDPNSHTYTTHSQSLQETHRA